MAQKRVFKYITLIFCGFCLKTNQEEHNKPFISFLQLGYPVVEIKWLKNAPAISFRGP